MGWFQDRVDDVNSLGKSLGGSFRKEVLDDVFNLDDLTYQAGVADQVETFEDAPDSLQGESCRDPLLTDAEARAGMGWTDQFGRTWSGFDRPIMSDEAARNYGSGINRGQGLNTLGQGVDPLAAHTSGFDRDTAYQIDQDKYFLDPVTNLWQMTDQERQRLTSLGIDPNLHQFSSVYPDIYGLDATTAGRQEFADSFSTYGGTDVGTAPDDANLPVLNTAQTTTGVDVPTTNANRQQDLFGLSPQSQAFFDDSRLDALGTFNKHLFDPQTGYMAGLENQAAVDYDQYLPQDPLIALALEEAAEGYKQSQLTSGYALQAGMGLIGSTMGSGLQSIDIAESEALRGYGGMYKQRRSNIGQNMFQAGVSPGSTAYQQAMGGAAGSAAAGRRDIGNQALQNRTALATDTAGQMVALITGTSYTPSTSASQGYNMGLGAGQAGVGSEAAGMGGDNYAGTIAGITTGFGVGGVPGAIIGGGLGLWYDKSQETRREEEAR